VRRARSDQSQPLSRAAVLIAPQCGVWIERGACVRVEAAQNGVNPGVFEIELKLKARCEAKKARKEAKVDVFERDKAARTPAVCSVLALGPRKRYKVRELRYKLREFCYKLREFAFCVKSGAARKTAQTRFIKPNSKMFSQG